MSLKLKTKIGILFFSIGFYSVCEGSPFLICNPYVPIESETITNVQIEYSSPDPDEDPIIINGSYIISDDYIILLDLASQYLTNIYYYRARWQSSDGILSPWAIGEIVKSKQLIILGNN